MYQDIHVADSILHDEVLAKWLAETYPEIFEIFNNEQLDNKVMEQLVLNAICTELVRLQTQHKDIGKENKIQLVDEVPMQRDRIMWNQLIRNGNMTNTDYWTASYSSRDVTNGELTLTLTSGTASNRRLYQVLNGTIPSGHKVYCKFLFKANRADYDFRVALTNSSTLPTTASTSCVTFSTSVANSWMRYRNILTTTSATTYFTLGTRLATNTSPTPVIILDNIQLFDLTAMFGAGNEPTISQFDVLFDSDYYDFNTGEEQIIISPPIDVDVNTVFFEIQEEGE